MLRRVRWMGMGAVAGAGATLWAQRRLRRQVERYLPRQLRAEVSDRARTLGDDLRSAYSEGRAAMAEREALLRRQLGRPPSTPGPRPALHVVVDPDDEVGRHGGGRQRQR